MKKNILIVDWLLVVILLIMVLSKFINLEFAKLLQPIFFGLILVHLIQHRQIMMNSLKKIIKKII